MEPSASVVILVSIQSQTPVGAARVLAHRCGPKLPQGPVTTVFCDCDV